MRDLRAEQLDEDGDGIPRPGAGPDDTAADPGGEAARAGIGDELDVGADPQEAGGNQKHARDHRGKDHAIDAVTAGRDRDQHDEGAGRAANLEAAAA